MDIFNTASTNAETDFERWIPRNIFEMRDPSERTPAITDLVHSQLRLGQQYEQLWQQRESLQEDNLQQLLGVSRPPRA